MKLRWSGLSDVGLTRDHNEDSYGIGEDELADRLGQLFVLCDGMGGHAKGEVASTMAVEQIITTFYEDEGDDRSEALEQAFQQANEAVYAEGHGKMGTTGVAALLHNDTLQVVNVGDSRAYLIHAGKIQQVSYDHSFVNDQVAAGIITPEEARSSPVRNVITRAIGYQSELLVDHFLLPVQSGDLVLLTSDGLHGVVEDAELSQAFDGQPLAQATESLIALANQRGGPDNITLVAVAVDGLDGTHVGDDTADTTPLNVPVTVPLKPLPERQASVSATFPPVTSDRALHGDRRLSIFGALAASILLFVLLLIIVMTLGRTPSTPPQLTPSTIAVTAVSGTPTPNPTP